MQWVPSRPRPTHDSIFYQLVCRLCTWSGFAISTYFCKLLYVSQGIGQYAPASPGIISIGIQDCSSYFDVEVSKDIKLSFHVASSISSTVKHVTSRCKNCVASLSQPPFIASMGCIAHVGEIYDSNDDFAPCVTFPWKLVDLFTSSPA